MHLEARTRLNPPSPGASLQMVNLDPAAEHFKYPVTIDVRDLISLEDVMEETEFGPNGGTARPACPTERAALPPDRQQRLSNLLPRLPRAPRVPDVRTRAHQSPQQALRPLLPALDPEPHFPRP